MGGRGERVTLLDVAALVIGAALGSVHLRGAGPEELSRPGWSLIWLAFAGISLSAAGPFVLLARRYGRRAPGYPRLGDWLWALLGLPWVLMAPFRPLGPLPGGGRAPPGFAFYVAGLWGGILLATLIALVVVWRRWVIAPPGEESRDSRPPWTDRVGLALAIAWPLQWGFGLVVAG